MGLLSHRSLAVISHSLPDAFAPFGKHSGCCLNRIYHATAATHSSPILSPDQAKTTNCAQFLRGGRHRLRQIIRAVSPPSLPSSAPLNSSICPTLSRGEARADCISILSDTMSYLCSKPPPRSPSSTAAKTEAGYSCCRTVHSAFRASAYFSSASTAP